MISLSIAITIVGLILLISFGMRTLAKGVKDIDDADTKNKGEDE